MNARLNKHSGRIERGPALKYLAGLKWAWGRAYEAACKHDKIDPASRFVAFSDSNPFVQFVDKAAANYFDARATYESGGYVGLQLTQTKGMK